MTNKKNKQLQQQTQIPCGNDKQEQQEQLQIPVGWQKGLFHEAFQHVGRLYCGLRVGRGHQGVELVLAVLLEDGKDLCEQRRLRGVGAEGVDLLMEDGADVEGECPGCGQGLRAAFEEEVLRLVEEALRDVHRAEVLVAFGAGGPVDCGSRSGGDDGVVGVGVGRSVHAEGEHDVGAKDADALDEFSGELGEVSVLELGVVVVEHLVVVDAEDVAGCCELGAAELAELFGGVGVAAIGAGLAVGEAEDVGLDTAGCGECECATEGEALIVGVGDDAEEAKAQAGNS